MTVTVTFHRNGGHDVPDSKTCVTYESDEECYMTLPSQVPYRDGYVFLGWGQGRDSYPEFQPDQIVRLDSSRVSLYAIWAPINTVRFDLNGGEGEIEPLTCNFELFKGNYEQLSRWIYEFYNYKYPDAVTDIPPCHVILPETEPTREGYTFIGWYDSRITDEMIENGLAEAANRESAEKGRFPFPYAAGSVYFMGRVFKQDSDGGDVQMLESSGDEEGEGDGKNDYRLYAVWAPANTLTFDLNGGVGDIPAQSCPIINTEKTRMWSGLIGEVLEYEDEYYDYYYDFDLNPGFPGALDGIYPGDYYFNFFRGASFACDITIQNAEPTREGYKFLGWAEKETVDAGEYFAGDTITIDEDKTLYAIWAPVYTLSYDLNGGEGEVPAKTCDPSVSGGATCTLEVTVAIPTRENYFFLGWAETADSDDDEYTAGQAITLSGSRVLYAIWAPIYTLTFDANGGLTDTTLLSCHSVTTVSAPCEIMIPNTVPIREGYDFYGWAESETATEAQYQPGDTIVFGRRNNVLLRRILMDTRANDASLTESKVLYAVWEEKMPVPDAGGDDDPTPTPTPTPTPKPDDTPSKPDTGRMTEENNHSNIINTIAIFILVPSILALGGYTVKRYNDKKKMFFDNNR